MGGGVWGHDRQTNFFDVAPRMRDDLLDEGSGEAGPACLRRPALSAGEGRGGVTRLGVLTRIKWV